jgi:hypothetical protein
MGRKKIHVKEYDRRPPKKEKETSWVEKAASKIDKGFKKDMAKLEKDLRR